MKLSLHTQPDVPLETEVISPDRLAGKTAQEVAALPVFHGNRALQLGDFFDISEDSKDDTVELTGDLSKVKLIGSDMSYGRLKISGDVGDHLGAGMSGGEITVNGNTGDWVGREMSGGRITIKGNAGHMVGSAVRGAPAGMQGGEILVFGNVKNEAGNGMRRGLIVIGGNSGDFAGVNMKAGTILVLGQLGKCPGASMVRGSIVCMQAAELLPTFTYNTTYQPSMLRNLLIYIRKLGFSLQDDYISGNYQRWSGDSIELNKGEIFLYAGD